MGYKKVHNIYYINNNGVNSNGDKFKSSWSTWLLFVTHNHTSPTGNKHISNENHMVNSKSPL